MARKPRAGFAGTVGIIEVAIEGSKGKETQRLQFGNMTYHVIDYGARGFTVISWSAGEERNSLGGFITAGLSKAQVDENLATARKYHNGHGFGLYWVASKSGTRVKYCNQTRQVPGGVVGLLKSDANEAWYNTLKDRSKYAGLRQAVVEQQRRRGQ